MIKLAKKILFLNLFIFFVATPLLGKQKEEELYPKSSGVDAWVREREKKSYDLLDDILKSLKNPKQNSKNFYFKYKKENYFFGSQSSEITLPKDRNGQIDWPTSVRTDLIHPVSSLFFSVQRPREIMNTKDIYHNSMHMYWLDCDSCHPKIFPQTKGATKNLSMSKIFAGEFCGKCHGKVAFSLSYCERCHINPQPYIFSKPEKNFPLDNHGMINWVAAFNAGLFTPFDTINGKNLTEPEDQVEIGFIEGFQGGSNRTGLGNLGGGIGGTLVFFPHQLHSSILTCDSCHPDPFPKEKGGTKNMGMANIEKGKYCGKCHGKVAFTIENCIRCHPKGKKVTGNSKLNSK